MEGHSPVCHLVTLSSLSSPLPPRSCRHKEPAELNSTNNRQSLSPKPIPIPSHPTPLNPLAMSFNDLERGASSSTGTARSSRPFGGIPMLDDDDSREYQFLVRRISQQVFNITNNVGHIHKLIASLGTAKDTAELRNSLHVITEDTREMAKDINNDIKTLSRYETEDPQKARQRKTEQQKLSKDFQKVISDFQKAQRVSAEKQREYVDKAKASVRNDLYEEEELMDRASEDQPLIDDSERRMQLQVLDNEVEYNETLIAEREAEIRDIEEGITEITKIFHDLGTLVTEQDPMISSIFDNVHRTVTNVRGAGEELVKAAHSQRSARNRMCCLLLIFTVITGVVVLVIVVAR